MPPLVGCRTTQGREGSSVSSKTATDWGSSMMNKVQQILWDMQQPLYQEINELTSMLPSPSIQASLDRLNTIDQLIKDAWTASEGEEE
jgi:hypothetical protein